VSGASVHVSPQTALGAWRLLGSDTEICWVNVPLEHQHLSHSYRHGLETCYHALKDVTENLTETHQITQYVDCERGLTKLDTPISSPPHTMGTNIDLVMAYWELYNNSQHTITRKWVMGHADDKR